MVFFHIIEMINNNTYKMDVLDEYGVNATFNIFDISLFDVGDDSRRNPFKHRGNDWIEAIPRDSL